MAGVKHISLGIDSTATWYGNLFDIYSTEDYAAKIASPNF